jgi:hypothetical protein
MASMTELITPKQQAETYSAVERIGAFAFAARQEHLTTDSRQLFKRNILDSIACANAAVEAPCYDYYATRSKNIELRVVAH